MKTLIATSVYLCHKCSGVLTDSTDTRAYRCGCISSYVRDWQKPVDVTEVRKLQIATVKSDLKLFAQQGRPVNARIVTAGQSLLRHLEESPT
jgi:hypothetical protein